MHIKLVFARMEISSLCFVAVLFIFLPPHLRGENRILSVYLHIFLCEV